jgi:hypothetical protein
MDRSQPQHGRRLERIYELPVQERYAHDVGPVRGAVEPPWWRVTWWRWG